MKGWLSGEPVDLGATGELVSEIEPITPDVALRERLLLGLRLAEGVVLDELERDTRRDRTNPRAPASARSPARAGQARPARPASLHPVRALAVRRRHHRGNHVSSPVAQRVISEPGCSSP